MTLQIEHDQVVRICRRLIGTDEAAPGFGEVVMPDTQKEMTSDEAKAMQWGLILLIADVTGLDYPLASVLLFGEEPDWIP